MRTLLVSLVILALAANGLACDRCGRSCRHGPEWAYAYENAYFVPDCAPPQLAEFHELLVPIMEARRSHESSFIRENARCLYRHAKAVLKAKPCCCKFDRRHFKEAAHDLVEDCDRLQELVYGGSNSAIYGMTKQIEEDFVRLANLCE
jgi:hypothetical protein